MSIPDINSREGQSHLHPSEVHQRPLLLLPEDRVPAHGLHLVPWHSNWSQLRHKLSQSVGWSLGGTGPALGAQRVLLGL